MDGQTDRGGFMGSCTTNVERPIYNEQLII